MVKLKSANPYVAAAACLSRLPGCASADGFVKPIAWLSVALIAGCSGSMSDELPAVITTDSTNNESVLELTLPRALVSLRALTINALSLEVVLDDDVLQVFREQETDRWTVDFTTGTGQHVVELNWMESYQGTNLLLASQRVNFEVGTEPVVLALQNDYTTFGPGFDVDGDGASNLQERLAESDPLVADFTQINVAEPDMVAIDAGCFVIGSPFEEVGRRPNEAQKSLCIDAFAMGKYEITFSQYDQFASEVGRELPFDHTWGRGNLPVVSVNWYEAVAYTEWLSNKTGKTWRLPTEAEWEYAARAGTSTPFSTGALITDEQANFDATATYGGSSFGVYRKQTTPVGLFAANAWGLHDMHGNVAEYTCSERSTTYPGTETACVNESHTNQIMVRGGSWRKAPGFLRSANRDSSVPTAIYFDSGFRVVREN